MKNMLTTPIKRVIIAISILSFTFPIYLFINSNFAHKYDLYTHADQIIPFLPWTILIYLSFYLLILAGAWLCKPNDFMQILLAILLANLACYIAFYFFTSYYPRPSLAEIESPFWHFIYSSMWESDLPGNTFPSIHIATTFLITLGLWNHKLRIVWTFWFICIALSTLTTKQHFLVDIPSGIGVSLISYWLAVKGLKKYEKPSGN